MCLLQGYLDTTTSKHKKSPLLKLMNRGEELRCIDIT